MLLPRGKHGTSRSGYVNIRQNLCVILHRRRLPDRATFGLTKRREEHQGNQLHPSPSAPPESQRRAMRKHSDPPLGRSARQTRKPRLQPRGFFIILAKSLKASRRRERDAGHANVVRPEPGAAPAAHLPLDRPPLVLQRWVWHRSSARLVILLQELPIVGVHDAGI